MNLNKLVKLSGDASFRKFYRNKKNGSIIVYCKKNKFINLVVYDAINKLLNKNNINAPSLIRESYKNNYIEIADLGNISALKKFKKFKIKNYEKLLNILKKFKQVKQRKIKTFNKKVYKIPNYSNNKLYDESKLFSKWYLPTKFNNKLRIISVEFNTIIKKLIKNLKLKKKIFVHRDFHISNIMLHKNFFFLIDNQDAVYGNQAYDVASLIDDVRIKISLKDREKLYKKFLSINKNINKSKFRNDFEILSVLRNFKIIGIFTRLSRRDKKHKYLKKIPYAWQMIDERRKISNNFKELNTFLDKYFSKNIKMNK